MKFVRIHTKTKRKIFGYFVFRGYKVFQIEILGYQDKKERKERKKDIVNTGKNTRIEKF